MLSRKILVSKDSIERFRKTLAVASELIFSTLERILHMVDDFTGLILHKDYDIA